MDTSSPLHLYLLGRFRLEHNGKRIQLPRRKVEALLAYLVLHPQVHTREKLATLFWGDVPDAQARHSLRTALNTLRKQLGDYLLLTDRETVQLNPKFPVWIDVREFSSIAHRLLPIADGEASMTSDMQFAISLYQGDLLADFYDDWIEPLREQYRALYLDALLQLTQQMRAQSAYNQAIAFGEQVLRHDPANEQAHQHLMFCYMATGNRQAALQQYETCMRVMQAELAVSPAPETIALYEWIRQTPSEIKSSAALITNLPIPLSSFIGRNREMTEVKRLLVGWSDGRVVGAFNAEATKPSDQPTIRLLTLVGAGGSGKTRLAIQVGTDLIDAFCDGVWWVELAVLSDETLVPQAIAKALGVRESPNQPLQETLVNYLRGKQLLLVLDNCEHLTGACAYWAETLLQACSRLTILATSREVLGISGESVWPVPTLSLPDSQQIIQLLMQSESVRLFVERAVAIKSDFTLTAQNAFAVAHICRRLDGIPLAIELATARVKVLSVEQIATRLDDRFELLTMGSRTALPRQQTLRATLDWSHDLLDEAECTLFRRLSAFAGDWTLEAAEAVCAGDGIERGQVLDLLSHLADKSLVLVEQHYGEARFRMLETMREYAREKLLAAGEGEQIQSRHLAFFTQLALTAEPALEGPNQAAWLNRLEIEHDNLRAVLSWALECDDGDSALRLGGVLGAFWSVRGYWSEGWQWLQRALAISRRTTNESLESRALRSKALAQASVLVLNDFGMKHALAEESLALSREVGDKQGMAFALERLGSVARLQGDYVTAWAFYQESLALRREMDDKGSTAIALHHLGLVAHAQGDYATARSLFQESFSFSREVEDKGSIGIMLYSLGNVAQVQGDYGTARALFQEGLSLSRALGDKRGIAGSLSSLGLVAQAQGDYATARALVQESLALNREVEDKRGITITLTNLGHLALIEGDYAAAWAQYAEGLALMHESGDKRGIAECLVGCATLAQAIWEVERATKLCGFVERLLQVIGARLEYPEREMYERTVTALRAQLDESRFIEVSEAGRSMELEHAVAYALAKSE